MTSQEFKQIQDAFEDMKYQIEKSLDDYLKQIKDNLEIND